MSRSLTVDEAAEALGGVYSAAAIRKWARDRKIPASQAIPRGKWLIPASWVEQMRAGHTSGHTAETSTTE